MDRPRPSFTDAGAVAMLGRISFMGSDMGSFRCVLMYFENIAFICLFLATICRGIFLHYTKVIDIIHLKAASH